jgi:hypothetical protein
VDELSISSKNSVFETPWFELVGKRVGNDAVPHYSISTRDYLSVLAVTPNGTFPLVRQFRRVEGGHAGIAERPFDEIGAPEVLCKREQSSAAHLHEASVILTLIS